MAEPRTRGQAAARAPLPPPDTGRARPRALPLRFGAAAAGEGAAGSGSLRRARHGAAPCPLLFRPPRQPVTIPAAAPAPPSTEHMFPLRLLAWLAMSHGQGKEVLGTKAGSETRNLHACADLTGDAERSDTIHPSQSSAAAFLSPADTIMLPHGYFKKVGGQVSIPLRIIPEQIMHRTSKRLIHLYVELSDPETMPKSPRRSQPAPTKSARLH